MTTRGGDGQRPLGVLLPADVGEVDVVVRRLLEERVKIQHRRLQRQLAGKKTHRVGQRTDAVDLDVVNHRSLAGVFVRHDQAAHAVRPGQQRHRQRPLDWPHTTIEREFARDEILGGVLATNLIVAKQKAQCDRQVERRPLLLHVGGGKVDGRAGLRQQIAGVDDCAADAVNGFLHRRVGQTDQRYAEVSPPRHVDFDLTGLGVDPQQRQTLQAREHGADCRCWAAPGQAGESLSAFHWPSLPRDALTAGATAFP